ncbi:MAG: GntR family transcriptional regulator [Oscillospiraceae bacterium]|jgi:GntR family transcriptional regulator|nr:GntR family transcriptional regulator [Oscillospiraceae bacterium]
MLSLDFTSREPIYEQLKNKIIKLSASGVLAPNEKLPSVRNLAKELLVNPNTVQKAYQDLEREGVIYSVPGRGSFVSEGIGENERVLENARRALSAAARGCRSVRIRLEDALELVKKVYREDERI